MRIRIRRIVAVGLAGAAAASIAVAGPEAATSGARPPADSAGGGRTPARLLVYAQEWSLWPSRPSIKAGTVIVQMWNRGQDSHDLRVRRLSHGAMVGRTQGDAVTQSGKLSQATWRLSPGTYELYCSMPGHLKKGMHTRITVR
jgi:plastocyanin